MNSNLQILSTAAAWRQVWRHVHPLLGTTAGGIRREQHSAAMITAGAQKTAEQTEPTRVQ